ncbi:MAG: hypothetical protein ABI629_02460 [bacterium]
MSAYPWLEADDVRACLVYARRLVGHERVARAGVSSSAGITTTSARLR